MKTVAGRGERDVCDEVASTGGDELLEQVAGDLSGGGSERGDRRRREQRRHDVAVRGVRGGIQRLGDENGRVIRARHLEDPTREPGWVGEDVPHAVVRRDEPVATELLAPRYRALLLQPAKHGVRVLVQARIPDVEGSCELFDVVSHAHFL